MSSLGTTPGTHLQNLILNVNSVASNEQKIECVKLLRTVVKNLADPKKSVDPKFRQLRLSNEKVSSKLSPCPSGSLYLESIGFSKVQDSDGSNYLRIDASKQLNITEMQAALTEVSNAYDMLSPTTTSNKTTNVGKGVNRNSAGFSEEKKTPEGIIKPAVSSNIATMSKLSEKQKARLLMEKKKRKEVEEAKRARARTRELIKQDKHVRENDENWKSGQSAACVKSGDKISTFRDKYGE